MRQRGDRLDHNVTPDSSTGRSVRFAAGVCAAASGALATFVLVSWLTGQWRLGTLGADYVVMAPSTACLMMLLSITAFFQRFFQNRDAGRFLTRLSVTAIAATALLSWSRQLLGFYYPDSESRIDAITIKITGVNFSPASSLTMLLLILTGIAFFFDLSSLAEGRAWRRLGPLAALAGLFSSLMVILGYAMGAPPSYAVQTTQAALPTALCLGLLNAAILLDASSGLWPLSAFTAGPEPGLSRMRRFAPVLSVLFAFLIVSMGVVGGLYLRQQQAEMRRAAQNELETIADAQIGLIARWRAERINDARFFMDAPFDAEDLQGLQSDPGTKDNRAGILAWLSVFAAGDRYRQITVYDADLRPRTGIPTEALQPDPALRETLSTVFRENRSVMTDLRFGEDHQAFVDILAPLSAKADATPDIVSKPGVAILLRVDARQLVSSLVNAWPAVGLTVDTLLVRRNSGDMFLLDRKNIATDTPLRAAIPIVPSDQPGAMGARGESGIVEGPDYRGVPVLSAVRRVSDTPWSIVVKMDESAIYAPSSQQMVQTAVILLLLILVTALGIGILWRQREIAFYRGSLDLEREHRALAQRFEHLMKRANDIIILAGADGTIREANNRALQSYGYSLEALRKMRLSDLRSSPAHAGGKHGMDELKSSGSGLFDSVHGRADGSTFPVEVSGSTVEIGGESWQLAIVRDVSEREQAAEALRASEQNFRTLFDSINDFLFVVNMWGDILRVNETVRVRLGYTNEELTGKSLLFLHPKNRRDEALRILGAMVTGETDRCGVPLLTRDGRLIEVETSIVKGLWSGQEVFFGMSRDISALRASEEKFIKLFQSNPALMAISTMEEGLYQDVNETFLQSLGYTREELIGRTSTELNLFADPGGRDEIRMAILENGSFRNLEMAVRSKDGQIRNGLFSGELLQMPEGQVLLTVMNDVTELKRAEEALVRIGKAVESASDAIGISDPNCVHSYQNRAFTEMFGYTVEDLASISNPTVGYADPAKGREVFEAIMRGDSWWGELEMVAKDGRQFLVALQADAIKDERGNIIGLLGVHRDITQRKRREEERQRLLDQTQRDARTKAELLAEVNHRVKNNLMAILALLLGEKQHAPGECRDQVISVLDSLALRIRGLLQVHQMLSDAHWEPIRLSELAVRVIRAALVAVPRGREINVTVKPSPAQISPRQAGSMALIINELAVNTAKHAMHGRMEVNIMVGVRLEEGTIRLEYRDDGPGYPDETLREGGGSVGIHLVRQLACETLRGTLNLYSEDGAVAVLCIKPEAPHHT